MKQRVDCFESKVLAREQIGGGHDKPTYHVELCLKGSDLKYVPGDSLGVYADNQRQEVEGILEALGLLQHHTLDNGMPLETYLRSYANLVDVPKKWKDLYPDLQGCWVSDFLQESGYRVTPEELVANLRPLLPRFYSIASSQEVVGDVVHLTVADVMYESHGYARRGVCSSQLCGEGEVFDVFVQPTQKFRLPNSRNTDIIMIGPGTGIAPFRSFMQHRMQEKGTGRHWLFFGAPYQHRDYFYQSYWETLEGLKISLAFSRDQEHKRYVQHLIQEQAGEFWDWMDRGACLYVCGDAKKMAKDVHQTLLESWGTQRQKTAEEAKDHLRQLMRQGKYLRDIY